MIAQINLIDIFRTFHPTIAEYTFFSHAPGMCTKKDHILGHKTSLNELKSIQVSMFSDCSGIKLQINNRMISEGKKTKHVELNSTVLNSAWVKKEIKGN